MTKKKETHAPMTFQQKALGFFGAALQEAFSRIPELRSVAVVFDWHGKINEGAVPFVWDNRAHQITIHDTDIINGMAEQSSRLLRATTEAMVQAVAAGAAALNAQAAQAQGGKTFEQRTQEHPLHRFAEPSDEDKAARQAVMKPIE
jgi:catabolite regulation protein CreA